MSRGAGTSGEVTAAELAGSTFTSVEVSGRQLIEGSTIRLTVDQERLGLHGGCNAMSAPFAVVGGRLRWTGPAISTLMACSPALMEQDRWLGELFTDGVDASFEGSTLVLTSGQVTIRMSSSRDASLDDLFGRTWTVTTLIDSDIASSVPAGVRTPRLTVDADGSAVLDTGCNRGRTTVTVADGALAFGPVALTRMMCPGAAGEVERAVVAVIAGDAVGVNWDGRTLTLTKGDLGLRFEVS